MRVPTGKTVFIEPTEVVEANNRVRELEGEERGNDLHPHRLYQQGTPILQGNSGTYRFLAIIDLIQAKKNWLIVSKP